MFTQIPLEKFPHAPPARVGVRPLRPRAARLADPQTLSPEPAPGISFDLGALSIFPPDGVASSAPLQRRLAIDHKPRQEEQAVMPSPVKRLPEPLQTRLEHLSGLPLDDVRVEYNSPHPALLRALAYTQGSRIALGRGQERYLPHEAWHVVQQKQGRVKPTLQEKGVAINDDEGLEREADRMAGLPSGSAAPRLPPLHASRFAPHTAMPGQAGPGVIQAKRYRWVNDEWVVFSEDADNDEQPEYKVPAKGKEGYVFDDQTGEIVDKDGKSLGKVTKRKREGSVKPRKTRAQIAAGKKEASEKRQKKKEDPVRNAIGDPGRKLMTQADNIKETLAAGEVSNEKINAIFDPVETVYEKYETALSKKGTESRRAKTSAEHAYTRALNEAIGQAWLSYNYILPENLQPSGETFKEQEYTGSPEDARRRGRDYFTGEDENQAIPIVWYKAPTDYPKIKVGKEVFEMKAGVEVKLGGDATLKPAAKNLPPREPGEDSDPFILQKLAHHEDRAGQKELNTFINAHAEVQRDGKWISEPMGQKGGFDGDHIKDLGFGGDDKATNYWPLAAKINRRAYEGYNRSYIVNYRKSNGELASKPIGGMISKYFKVKGYIQNDSSVPVESAKPYAGTWKDE